MNSKRNIRLLMRTMAMVISGILISIAFLANVDTYSWFTNSSFASVKVTAADTEDIIDTLELVYESEDPETGAFINPTALRIRKAAGFDDDPLIFFSVEGEAAEYILNINPVRLDSNAYFIIPIETDINIKQYSNLDNRSSKVEGHIRIKYMNEYMNVGRDIEFTKEFLINRLMVAIIRDTVREEEEQPKAVMMRTATYIEAPALTVYSIKEERKKSSIVEDTTIKAITSLAELVEWKGADYVLEDGRLSDEALLSIGFSLTTDQEFLMDIIYPGLKEYLKGLKSYIAKLKTEIEDRNAQLASLDEQLMALESQYDELVKENESLLEQIDSLALVQPPAQPPVSSGGGIYLPPASTGGGTSGGGSSGSSGGGSGTQGGDATDPGTTPDNGTPGSGTGSGTSDTGAGDTGSSDTGDTDTGTDDAGGSDTGDTGTGTGDIGDGDTTDAETGNDGAGDSDTGNADDGSNNTAQEPGDNDDAVGNPTDEDEQDAITGGNEDEEAADSTAPDDAEEDDDTADEDTADSSQSTSGEASANTGELTSE